MVVTRNSQQQHSQSQSKETRSKSNNVSDDSSDEEPLDVKKRKIKAASSSSQLSATSRSSRSGGSLIINGFGHSRDTREGRFAAAAPAILSSSQKNARELNLEQEYEDEVQHFDNSSSASSHHTSEDGDFELEEPGVDQSSVSPNDAELVEACGQRRSRRQKEKVERRSWVTMDEKSAKGYPGTRRASLRLRSGSGSQIQNGQMDPQRKESKDGETVNDCETNVSSQGLYTRIKTRHRRKSSAYTSPGTSAFSPRQIEPVASRLRARNHKSYNVTETFRKVFRPSELRARRRKNSDESDSDDEAPRRLKKAIMISNDGSQQFASGIEGFEPIKPDTSINFTSIGGLDDFVLKIREVILFPMLYKPFYENRRITPPRGLLLHGPPGTGKTLLARAVAGEATRINGKPVSFFMLKGSEVQTKWVGESEKALRELFKTATSCQPSIIFFDEFDGLAASRSVKTDQFHNSLVSTFLAEMDGLRDRGQIIVIGATNRIEAIDPAFRRAGRLDFELQFRLPDYNARREIIAIHTKDWPDAPAGREMEELASLTAGYNGADLKLICSQACLNALKRRYPQIYKRKEKLAIDYDSIKVLHIDFVQALEVVPKSSFRSTLAMTALPLPELLKPLLQRSVDALKARIDYIFQIKNPGLISPCRKRILIFGDSQYIVPAVLYTMDSLAVSAISTQTITLAESESRAIGSAFSEASVKRGVLCIQDIDKVYKMLNPLGRLILHQELNKIDDVSLVLATSTDLVFPEELIEFFERCQFELLKTTSEERHDFFHKIFIEEAYRVRVEIPPPEEEELDVAEADDLSEGDLQIIEKLENRKLRGLRIFLRDTLQKLARNRKFVEFTKAVNVNEVPDYLNIIKNPMDFEKMMDKVNNGEYLSAAMFLKDIDLIAQNCLNYNPATTDVCKQIRLKALALLDEAQNLIERELDSDFELECQQIAVDREERKRRREENPQDTRKKTPTKRRKSRENCGESSLLPTLMNDGDLGFRKTPYSERYRKLLDNCLRKIVQATEKSTLLEMTALRSQLSCACQHYYNSEDKDALVAELSNIVNNVDTDRKKLGSSKSAERANAPFPAPVPSSQPRIKQSRRLSFNSSESDGDNDAASNNTNNSRSQRRMNGHI